MLSVPHSWNANRLGDEYDFRVKHVNWLSQDGWRGINTAIGADRTATELPYEVSIPADSQGECVIEANNRFSMRRHILEENGTNSEPGLSVTVQAVAQRNVTGHADPANPSRWLYPKAWPGTTLSYEVRQGRATRIEKVLEIDPTLVGTGTLSYSFLVTSSRAEAFTDTTIGKPRRALPSGPSDIGTGQPLFLSSAGSELRGVTVKPALAWYLEDGEKVTTPIRMSVQAVLPGVYRFTKHLPADVVQKAAAAGSKLWTDATFYPDPSPETSTADGSCLRYSADSAWYTLRNTAGTFGQDNLASYAMWMSESGTTTNKWDRITRIGLSFDTSSLSGSIESASLEQFNTGFATNQLGFDHTIYYFNPASNTAVVAADFTLGRWGTTAWSDSQYTTTEMVSGSSQVWAFNATGLLGIEVDDVTSLGIRSVNDTSSANPPWQSNKRDDYTPYFSEQSGTTSDPKLEVTMIPSGSTLPGGASLTGGFDLYMRGGF